MITCWNCERDNEAFFKFCLACGSDLDGKAPEVVAKEPAASAQTAPALSTPSPSVAGAGQASEPEVAVEAAAGPCLVLIRPDQTEGARLPLQAGRNSLGRSADITFGADSFLRDHHLDLHLEGESVEVVPAETRNGTFLRLTEDVELHHGDQFRIGQQLLRLEWLDRLPTSIESGPHGETTLGSPVPDAAWGRLAVLASEDDVTASYVLSTDEVRLGREKGLIKFAHDPFVSGAHASLVRTVDGRVLLKDVGSRNGTFVRLRTSVFVSHGDTLLAGQQLLRVRLSA